MSEWPTSTIGDLIEQPLHQLFRALADSWANAASIRTSADHLPGGKFAKLRVDHKDRLATEEIIAKFQAAIAETDSAFRLLFEYVKETFPDLDIRETDAAAWTELRR